MVRFNKHGGQDIWERVLKRQNYSAQETEKWTKIITGEQKNEAGEE